MALKQIKLLSGKIHRASVTATNVNYIGSIRIDSNLLKAAGILPLEQIEIANLTNGNRWSTYALPADEGNGEICPNGGGALLAKPNDILIIWSYVLVDQTSVLKEGHEASVVLVNQHNQIIDCVKQKLIGKNGQIIFEDSIKAQYPEYTK